MPERSDCPDCKGRLKWHERRVATKPQQASCLDCWKTFYVGRKGELIETTKSRCRSG